MNPPTTTFYPPAPAQPPFANAAAATPATPANAATQATAGKNANPASPPGADGAFLGPYLTAALYLFVSLPDCADWRDPLQAFCETHHVKGTLLLAGEGINGTIAGPEAGVRAVLAHLRADPRLAALPHKESWSDKPPFSRMKVRLKPEIVTLRVPGLDPTQTVGQYVKPQDWNALLADPAVLLIDTRNDYEVAIGTFAGAVDPQLKKFTDLPAWLDAQPQLQGPEAKKTKVAMFCTGGIRCEKSTALMKMRGFDEVYHLEGGILKYLEEVPPEHSTWQGDCFVFDERVSVGHGLQVGPHALCRSCRWPLSEADKASPHYVLGVSCAHCHDQRTPEQKAHMAERQRQVELAEARGEVHVGAKMPDHTPATVAAAAAAPSAAPTAAPTAAPSAIFSTKGDTHGSGD